MENQNISEAENPSLDSEPIPLQLTHSFTTRQQTMLPKVSGVYTTREGVSVIAIAAYAFGINLEEIPATWLDGKVTCQVNSRVPVNSEAGLFVGRAPIIDDSSDVRYYYSKYLNTEDKTTILNVGDINFEKITPLNKYSFESHRFDRLSFRSPLPLVASREDGNIILTDIVLLSKPYGSEQPLPYCNVCDIITQKISGKDRKVLPIMISNFPEQDEGEDGPNIFRCNVPFSIGSPDDVVDWVYVFFKSKHPDVGTRGTVCAPQRPGDPQ